MESELSKKSLPGSVPRTRNGLQLACEPCRKRKVACDHSLPVCRKCRQRKISSKCIYKHQRPSRVSPASSGQWEAPSTRFPLDATTPQADEKTRFDRNTGYLGATSISTLMQEAQSRLLPSRDQAPMRESLNERQSKYPEVPSTGTSRLSVAADNRALETAIDILICIPQPATSRILLQKNGSPIDGWSLSAVLHICDSLWQTFSADLEQPRSHSSLLDAARTLYHNTAQPLNEGKGDWNDWLASFSGRNLRWESVGILFAHWTVGAMQMPDDSDFFLRQEDTTQARKDDMVSMYLDCTNLCIDLCRSAKSGNTLLTYLLLKSAHLTSVRYGDASKSSLS